MELACPDCGGSGQSCRSERSTDARCWRCQGRGLVAEPRVNNASLRRWVKIAQLLAGRPALKAVEVDDALDNVYGRASVTGILGAMRAAGLAGRDQDSRWRLSDGGFVWQQQFCRRCRCRLPRHKSRHCPAPSPIDVLGIVPEEQELGTGALSALLELAASAQSAYRITDQGAGLCLEVSRPLTATEAQALAQELLELSANTTASALAEA